MVARRNFLTLALAACATLSARPVDAAVDRACRELHFVDRNRGPDRRTLVFIHGWAASSRAWDPLLARWPTTRALAYDLRGFGASPRSGRLDYARHLRDLDCVLARAGAARVVLVGHSFGALLAQDWALAHPARVAALVLLNSQSRAQQFALPPATRSLAESIVDETSRDAALRTLVPRYFGRAAGTELVAGALADAARAQPDALRESLLSASALAPIPRRRFAAAGFPVLVVETAEDIVAPGTADRLAAEFRDGRVARLEGSGHSPALERPAELASIIESFLASLPPRR